MFCQLPWHDTSSVRYPAFFSIAGNTAGKDRAEARSFPVSSEHSASGVAGWVVVRSVKTVSPPPADSAESSGVVSRLPARPLREVRALLEAMLREKREPGASSSLLLGSYFSSVVILLARRTVGAVPAVRSDWRLGGVVNYMQCHLSERLPVERLARLAAMSQSTLLRAFKEAFGCGPAKYFASLRLGRAVELFRTTNLTVGEVAWKTGFFDESHLRKKIAQELHTSIVTLRGKPLPAAERSGEGRKERSK